MLLYSQKQKTSRGFKKLVSDFSIDSETVQKAFLLANRNASESFLKSFQYKILNDITFTNSRLAKIGYIPCDLCTFCDASPETRDHLFYLCKYAKEFGEQFEEFWMSIRTPGIKAHVAQMEVRSKGQPQITESSASYSRLLVCVLAMCSLNFRYYS